MACSTWAAQRDGAGRRKARDPGPRQTQQQPGTAAQVAARIRPLSSREAGSRCVVRAVDERRVELDNREAEARQRREFLCAPPEMMTSR